MPNLPRGQHFVCGCESTNSGDRAAGAGAGGHHDAHVMLTPDKLKWEPAPSSLPPGAHWAKLEGDPTKPGYFAMRIRFPANYKIGAHWHPNAERITIICGTFYLGQGESFDASAAQALPPGTYSAMPPGMRHFAFTKGPAEIQLATNGPWAIHYVKPADDPRKADKSASAAAP